MKPPLCLSSLIAGILFLLAVFGCGAGTQFVDGMAAATGQGGKIARQDVVDQTAVLANRLNKDQPLPQWETPLEVEGTDLIGFLDDDRVLVGTVESGSYLGIPDHGDLMVLDAGTGELIWTAGRPELANGHYALLCTVPMIVIVGRDDDATAFYAYDPATGAKTWQHQVAAPDQFLITPGLARIISFSSSGSGRKIEALDMTTGQVLWDIALSKDLFSAQSPETLLQGDGSVFVAGKQLLKLSEKDGRTVWSAEDPVLAAKDRKILSTAEGVLAYHPGRMVFFEGTDGSIRWAASPDPLVTRYATALHRTVFRVMNGEDRPKAAPADTIEAVSIQNGKVVWSKKIDGQVVSPLYLEKNILVFTTNEAVWGLAASTGKVHFRDGFSEAFIAGAPKSATRLVRPDILAFGNGNLYLAREMAGLRAYGFPSGKLRWEQLQFHFRQRAYSADRLYEVLTRDLPAKPIEAAPRNAPDFSPDSSSVFIQSAQRRYEYERQRTAAVLNNRYATTADRQSAHQQRAMNARLMAAQQQVDMAMGQMQAAGDLLVAVTGLQGAIQNALDTAAVQGVISRKYLELRSFMGLAQRCFQGGYYLWPFYEQGRGVTLVDLDTGKRNDLIFSPEVFPLRIFGVDLPTFRIAPDGKRLVMVGVSLRPDRYQTYVKWKYRMPQPAVLDYDLSQMDFMETSITQQRAEEKRLAELKKAEALTKEIQAHFDETKLHTAAQIGNVDRVKQLLDQGMDVNLKHPDDGSAPLIFAAIGGHAEVARLLIERGADVNAKNKNGKTALFFADSFGHKAVVDMLKAAGAR